MELNWVVFAAAALSLLAYFYFKNSDELSRARPVILLCSLVAPAIMLYKYIDFKSGAQDGLQGLNQLSQMFEFKSNAGENFQMPDIGFHIKFGGIGTILGFVLTLIDGFFLGDTEISKPPRKAVVSYYQEADKVKEKI